MFTIEQIRAICREEVKSSNSFIGYLKKLNQLGIVSYHINISDGSSIYFGINNYQVNAPQQYSQLTITETCDIKEFKNDLEKYQQGKKVDLTFIEMCAKFGIAKLEISIKRMTSTYFDKTKTKILVERINYFNNKKFKS